MKVKRELKHEWIIFFVLAIVVGFMAIATKKATCYDCIGNVCYNNSSCLQGCSCMASGNKDGLGRCVGIY